MNVPHRITRHRNRWRAIASDLRHHILGGRYAPGDRLPSSAELRSHYHVSGQTVQHAMNALRDAGLITTRPGFGWFVHTPPEPVRLVRRPRLHEGHPVVGARSCRDNAAGDWRADVQTVLRFCPADAELAAELGVAPGAELLVRDRKMSEDGEVVAVTSSYLPRCITHGTIIESPDTGPGVLACLMQLGYRVDRHLERVTAGLASDEEAHRLGRHDRPVVLRLTRTALCRDVVPAVIRIVAVADRFELCYDLPLSAA